MRFLKEWGRLFLIGDEWADRILRWVGLAILLGLGLFLQQPLAISVGNFNGKPYVGLVIGAAVALVWLCVTAGLAWGRTSRPVQSPAVLKHLADLQAFAQKTRETVANLAIIIDMSMPIGRFFKSHYPDVVAKIESWGRINQIPVQREFYRAMEREARRFGLGRDGPGMMATLAEAQVEFDQLAWSIENDFVIVRVANTIWQVAEAPRGTAFEDIQGEVRNHVAVLRDLPEVKAYLEAKRQIKEQRQSLVDDLDTIVATHRLTGHCNGCP